MPPIKKLTFIKRMTSHLRSRKEKTRNRLMARELFTVDSGKGNVDYPGMINIPGLRFGLPTDSSAC